MQHKISRFVLAFVLLMGGLFANSSLAISKESITFGVGSEFDNLNPAIASQAVTSFMLYFAYRPTITLTPDFEWQPMLIKEIPTLENKMARKKGAGVEIDFEIIEKATWGDGTPVTCKDIEFAWQIGLNKNVSIGNREAYEVISRVSSDSKNPKKCQMEFTKLKYDYFLMIPSPMPVHLEGPVMKKYGNKPEGYDRNSLYTKDPTNPGLYNGPYRISEVALGSHVVMVPNQHFYGKSPFFQKVVIKLIPNTNTMVTNLQAGNIDVISSVGGLSGEQALAFEKKAKAEGLPFQVIFKDGVTYAHIDFNLDTPVLKDLKVRQAIAMATNREEILNSILDGKGKIAHSLFTELDPWFSKPKTQYRFNKREAARLLDEAGWKMGPKGIREKDGKPLTFRMMGVAGSKTNELIQTYMMDQLKSIGIELTIKNEPGRVFFGETTTKRMFDAALFSWVSIPEQSPRSVLHSQTIPTKENSWSGQNYTGYSNPKMDALIDQLETELDAKKRAEIGKQIGELYMQDLPVLPLYFRPANAVVPKGLKNFKLSGHLMYESLMAEDWSL